MEHRHVCIAAKGFLPRLVVTHSHAVIVTACTVGAENGF